MEIISNDYTKEYDEATKRIQRLEKQLSLVYERCEEICKFAKASWAANTPMKMADHCARLIAGERSARGHQHHLPYKHLSKVVDIREYKKKKYG